jgi:hypothetical protein
MASLSISANKNNEDGGGLAKIRDEMLKGSEVSRDGDSRTIRSTLIGFKWDTCVIAVIAVRVTVGKVVASFEMGLDTTNVDNETREAASYIFR